MRKRLFSRICCLFLAVGCICCPLVFAASISENSGDIHLQDMGNAFNANLEEIAPLSLGTIYESEINDTFATADTTYDDFINYGRISSSNDVDWWTITFLQAGRANFWLGDIPSGCNYNLELYAPDGVTLYASSKNPGNIAELIQFDVKAGVNYGVRVYSQSGSSTTKRYCLRIKNYPTIPANSIGVYVTDTNGQPISNAVVYIYRQKDTSAMYPYDPLYTNAYGFATKTGLSSSATYAINVIANNYASKAYSEYVTPSTNYVTIVLEDRDLYLNAPLTGFSAINKWPHNSSLSHVNACDKCGSYTRICPHTYFNVYIPQNFGWRYSAESKIEFHQGIDVSATTSDKVYNVFEGPATVIASRWIDGCGNTVQLKNGNLYATYMHLSSYSVTAGGTVNSNVAIGYAGNTGTYATHLHLSLSKDAKMWVDRTTSGSNILIWDSDQIESFLDPLAYID